MKYYTGIGSRSTPPHILNIMTQLATKLSTEGWTLRSGGTDGADTAFEQGALSKEIYLPWPGFNNSSSPLNTVSTEAMTLASKFHPAWDKLSRPVRLLMARNMYQVTGRDLNTPSSFLVCYTNNGKLVGGTRQAIEYAMSLGIEVINLGRPADLNRAQIWLDK